MRAFVSVLLLIATCFGANAQVVNAPTVNSSVAIVSGNAFQTLLPAVTGQGAPRRSLTIANNNATDACWIFVGGGAASKAAAIQLQPSGAYTRYFPYVPSDAIQGTCATTGNTIYVDTQ